jgi:hypothetical protein
VTKNAYSRYLPLFYGFFGATRVKFPELDYLGLAIFDRVHMRAPFVAPQMQAGAGAGRDGVIGKPEILVARRSQIVLPSWLNQWWPAISMLPCSHALRAPEQVDRCGDGGVGPHSLVPQAEDSVPGGRIDPVESAICATARDAITGTAAAVVSWWLMRAIRPLLVPPRHRDRLSYIGIDRYIMKLELSIVLLDVATARPRCRTNLV